MSSGLPARCFSLITILLFLCTTAGAAGLKLDRLLEQQEKLWQLSPPEFVALSGCRQLRWSSSAHNTLYYSSAHHGKLTLADIAIPELTVRFADNHLQRIEISIYNRGDVGRISKSAFQNNLLQIKKFLNRLFNKRLSPAVRRQRLAGRMVYSSIWQAGGITAKLRWSQLGRAFNSQPEFISLYIYSSTGSSSTKSRIGKKELPELVQHDEDGGVFLDIPMVDQGDKGYCVVAVLERVMKYYGSDIDQHLLAELAHSSAQSGTSLKSMTAALREADSKLGIKFKTLYINPTTASYQKFAMLLQYYNKEARKRHKPILSRNSFISQTGPRSYTYYPRRFAYRADPEIYTAVMLKYYRKNARRFRSNIKKYISRGIPILWSVTLGIFPEQGKMLPKGGHMRLIIGFNARKRQIYYSDSWGAGHELKKISYRQAWAMTNATFIIIPRHKRRAHSL